MTHTIETDALVIGAGPCGLFQVFQLGLQGISCCVIEALPHAGGQCAELYADKPIYDIPGIPHLLAGDLTTRLLQQIQPFNPTIHYGCSAGTIAQTNGGYCVTTDQNQTINARFIVLATGAGAFSAVKMRVDGIETFEHTQLFYQDFATDSGAKDSLSGKHVVVCGDTPAAIEAALTASEIATRTTYFHRKRRLVANDTLLASLTQAADDDRLLVINGKVTGFNANDNRLTHVLATDSNKRAIEVPTDIVLARLGNSPKVNDYQKWGLQAVRHHIEVDPANFQSALPGIYVVGDINTYPGKRKLILCGFHEATLTAFDIAARINPDKPVHTQYTTTSTELQKRLGLA